MKINVFQSRTGDAMIIEVKDKVIMIDGGTAGTYNELCMKIDELKKIDLLILTHYDDDHIAGVIKLFKDKERSKNIEKVYANLEKHIGVEEEYTICKENKGINKSSAQATTLQNLIRNEIWHEEAILKGHKFNEWEGIKISVLGPTKEILDRLKDDFNADVIGTDGNKGSTNKSNDDSEMSIKEILETRYEEDVNKANRASLVILIEVDKKKFLFPGDCSLTGLLEDLDEKLLEEGELKLELLKIPHHGSFYNTSLEALEKIRCSNYLLLTNGRAHKHPHKSTIVRILENNRNKGIKTTIYTNYDSLKKIKRLDKDNELDQYDWNNMKISTYED